MRLSNALLGWLPGGLAIVAVVACAFFTAFTGASGVTIVALGALLYPALRHARYPERFSLGLVTTSGSLGLLFAPSLPLILYGFVAGQMGTTPAVTIKDLFLAGLLPGLLMLVMLGGMHVGRPRDIARPRRASTAARCGRRSRTPPGSCRCRWSCWAASTRAASRPARRQL